MATEINIHLSLIRINPKGIEGQFQCKACNQTGTSSELYATECPVIPPSCVWCGHIGECAQDCLGMKLIFSDSQIYIVDAKE